MSFFIELMLFYLLSWIIFIVLKIWLNLSSIKQQQQDYHVFILVQIIMESAFLFTAV